MKQDLYKRLIRFSVRMIKLSDRLVKSPTTYSLGKQLNRCGTSPALNYSEALGSESKKDFIHKNQIALKELRESLCIIHILKELKQKADQELLDSEKEANELVSIFVAIIRTSKKNLAVSK